jgi:hypothetical protein
MVVEWTEGCRMGWRWAVFHPPDIAAVGEENFCDDTCPNMYSPCVDLAVESVDGASQWSSLGVGQCCEDSSIGCDHTDGTLECDHPASCSDGQASDFDAWCFGAPAYFASFVAGIYANTETTITLVPIGASGEHTVDPANNEIIMPSGGQMIDFEVFVAGWDPDLDGSPLIKAWQTTIDSSTYHSGLAGELTNSRPPCTTNSDCPSHDTGELCAGIYCAGAWQECPGRPTELCLDLPACDVRHANPRCGSTGFEPSFPDDGTPDYGMSLRLESSSDAKGTFEVGFLPGPWRTYLKNQFSVRIPFVALVPANVTIVTGRCCDRGIGPGNERCLDTRTIAECDAIGGFLFPGEPCDPDINDSLECAPFCGDDELNDPAEECDGSDTGACIGLCDPDCLCVHLCGDDEVNLWWEQCDGTDDALCPGKCRSDCRCIAVCGDDEVNQTSEQCDGANDNRCPGQCRDDCTCPPGSIPAVSHWGVIVLILLVLGFARIHYGRSGRVLKGR